MMQIDENGREKQLVTDRKGKKTDEIVKSSM